VIWWGVIVIPLSDFPTNVSQKIALTLLADVLAVEKTSQWTGLMHGKIQAFQQKKAP
jgi:hypothetical protein